MRGEVGSWELGSWKGRWGYLRFVLHSFRSHHSSFSGFLADLAEGGGFLIHPGREGFDEQVAGEVVDREVRGRTFPGGKAEADAGTDGDGEGSEGEECGLVLLRGALEAVPVLGGDAPEIADGGFAQIEEDEPEVFIPDDDIRGFHRLGHAAAHAQPEEGVEQCGIGGSRIETVEAVDEADQLLLAAGGEQQLVLQEGQAAALGWGAAFTQLRAGETAAEELVETFPASGEGRAFDLTGFQLGEGAKAGVLSEPGRQRSPRSSRPSAGTHVCPLLRTSGGAWQGAGESRHTEKSA